MLPMFHMTARMNLTARLAAMPPVYTGGSKILTPWWFDCQTFMKATGIFKEEG